MPDHPNFLIGYGERLTTPIEPSLGGAERTPPYSFGQAVNRVLPMLKRAVHDLDALPAAACPRDEAVAILTLHPQYFAKSYQPNSLLRAVGIEPIGSRPQKIKPEKWTKKSDPADSITTELFVAGPRSNFRNWAASLPNWKEATTGAADLFKVEQFRALDVKDRLRPISPKVKEPLLEIVLHASGMPESHFIIEAFSAYVAQFNMKPDLDRMFFAGGLCFMPLRAHRDALEDIAKFSFLRVAREMPSLRPLRPLTRASGKSTITVKLPAGAPVDPSLKVAVFDGGVPKKSELAPWVDAHDSDNIGDAVPEYLEHGVGVTSALLFGSLQDRTTPDRPFARVDHYRVLDKDSEKDPDELYDVLLRIRSILQTREYEFFNLSIGPSLPVEDTDVHGWTAALDEILCAGDILASMAVGNTGELDWKSANARIQVPSDCVNALAVGAADHQGKKWKRADYSSIGPGRSPGLVKPDLLAFGGSDKSPFWIINPTSPGKAFPTTGTSFASPEALRLATGIRAHFGSILSPLAIKALLIHSAEDLKHDRVEVGWGRIPSTLEEMVICPDGTARVVYQGELSPSQYLRAQIPLPREQLQGNVTIRATFCYATETDPQDPSNYTRSGLDVIFRPHDQVFDEDGVHPRSSSFFRLKDFPTEAELRRDAHKWETTIHRERRMRGSSLSNPMFDIHYNARESGGPTRTANKIRYALIVTVRSPRTLDLYDRVLRAYRNQLRPLMPVIQIPVLT